MKIFIGYFRDHFTKEFHLISHLVILLFIGISITLNYTFDIYPKHFRVSNYSEVGALKLWGMFAFAFLIPILILSVFKKENHANFTTSYILLGLLGLLFVTIDSSYYLIKYGRQLISIEQPGYNYVYKLMANGISLFTIIIPCFIVYIFVKKFKPELYGLRLSGANIKPYLWLIALMVPVVVVASLFDGDLLAYYPTYNATSASTFPYSNWIKIIIYEFFYGFDFISVELLFRGFMVVALSKFVGKHAILPMVCCYVFLHFGKPMMETIGSIFGGFALGILAYKSRNIYGGLIVHLGVAWTMEFVAFAFMK